MAGNLKVKFQEIMALRFAYSVVFVLKVRTHQVQIFGRRGEFPEAGPVGLYQLYPTHGKQRLGGRLESLIDLYCMGSRRKRAFAPPNIGSRAVGCGSYVAE